MRYLPLSPLEKEKILTLCGVKTFDQLTEKIPQDLKLKGLLDMKEGMSESEIIEHVSELADRVKASKMVSFLGQGVYSHDWPKVIDQISNRGEFLTAYTPYQPEISQGTLQMIFEYQSMIADLLGCEVSNASLYDGATSVVEGILMAARLQNLKSGKVYIAEGIFDRYRAVIESYLAPLGFELVTWRASGKTFTQSDTLSIEDAGKSPAVAVVMQSPNKWGHIEDWNSAVEFAKKLGTKSVAISGHTHANVLFQAPGHAGMDIVTGEAQCLGIPVGFGGPHLGMIACKKQDVRQMPGRLVGLSEDSKGQTAFCITLATREQHIRRDKATSNICSNQNLMALRACMYLQLMGPNGMKEVSEQSRNLACYARGLLQKIVEPYGASMAISSGEIFNEFSLFFTPQKTLVAEEFLANAEKLGIIAGTRIIPPANTNFSVGLALAFTEKIKLEHINKLLSAFPLKVTH